MEVPFSITQFLDLFARYNRAIQPVQFLAYALGILSVVVAGRGGRHSGRIVFSILTLLWAWMGVVYHMLFFSRINPAAYIFGAFFIAQALLFLLFGVLSKRMTFRFTLNTSSVIGAILMTYAVIIYPLLNYVFGHAYPNMPVFGVAPCPVTIFTFGILFWAQEKLPKTLLVIPLLWSVIGVVAAIKLGVVEDYGLAIAGLVGVMLIINGKRKQRRLL